MSEPVTGSVVRKATPTDALRIRQIIQHSEVRDTFFDGFAPSSLNQVSQIVGTMDRIVWLLWDGGVFMGIPMEDGWMDVNVAVLPDHRGAQAIEAAEHAVYFIFTRTPCVCLVGSTPLHNKPALEFAKMAGFQPVMETPLHRVNQITFFRWAATRENPIGALDACMDQEKAEPVRKMLHWASRGHIPAPPLRAQPPRIPEKKLILPGSVTGKLEVSRGR